MAITRFVRIGVASKLYWPLGCRFILGLAILPLMSCAETMGALPVAGAIAAPVITKKVAKDVVAEAEQAAQNLFSQAERTGNALAGRVGNELTVAAINTALVAGGELDRVVENLSKEVSVAVSALNDLIETANNFQKGAFEMKDALAIDLRAAMGDVRFFVAKTDFMVQRIDGITQLENVKSPEYRVALTGLGLGQDTSKVRSQIAAVVLNGKSARFVESRPRANRTEINFPSDELRAYFNKSKLIFVPLEVTVQVQTKKTFGRWESRDHRVPIRLALVPRTAATVMVSWATEKMDWVNLLPQPSKYTHTTPDHNCSSDCRFFPESGQQKVPGNQRFTSAQIFGCGGEGCRWTRNSRASILAGGTILEFWTEAQGSPATHTYGAMIQELRVVGELPGSKTYDLQYGSDLVIELPGGTKFWRIRGATTSFQPIDIVVDQSGDVLKYKRTIDSAGKRRVVYAVSPPSGL